ncbi:hypothetical protein [Miltoncostaea oceani]|jgi:hypothetical protein|uniref:hypothetical protein n=1 Tax=Miltoncostaea oceani TaxID=2843216 RepID=UPI001C3C834D|nr:hypothetical protein [Miltoncostaea oceani]
MRRRASEGPGDCAVCGRVVLPGEPVHHFVEPSRGSRQRVVCPLCHRRAAAQGWVRTGGSRDHLDRSAPAA